MRKVVIVVPTYNEAGNMNPVIDGIFKATADNKNWLIDVLVVDSSSTDKTGEVVQEIQKRNKHVHLLTTAKEGLGRAYIRGFQYAIDKINPYLLFEMDADLSHDPQSIPHFLKEIEKGSDFVVGSRYVKGGSIPQDWGIHRKILSKIGNLIIRYGFMNLKINDWTGGYRAIKVWVIKDSMPHIKQYSGYVFQMALLDYAIKHKANIKEIPIHFKERTYGISKINALQYIAHIFLYVFMHSSFIKFGIVGLTGFVLDFGITYLFKNHTHLALWIITVMSTESAIITNYLMNNYWAFSHKKLDSNKLTHIWSFIKFNLISSGSIVIQAAGIQLLSNFYGDKYWYIYKVCIILFIVIPYSYILYNKFIWKDK